jgi:crossover junction endodeoxyribonuclease RuvC
MKILGIDPALSITGYGLIDFCSDRAQLCRAGAIITTSKQKITERLEKIFLETSKLIKLMRPDVMVLEKVYVHYRHPTTAFILGQARGAVCLACARGKIPLIEYAATQVKKAIVGKGLASKYQVQRMVMNLLRLNAPPRYNDVTDALALAITHTHYVRTG